MDILKSMANSPKSLKPSLKESTLESANAPDISHVNVNEDFVSLVTEGKKPKVNKAPVVEQTKKQNLEELLESLSLVVKQANKILKEMCGPISPGTTTTGNTGANVVGRRTKRKRKI